MIIKHAGEEANSLDLWIQRGRLISAFRPDQGVLRVHVNLRAELPAGDLERAVQTIGFEVPRRQRLSIPYVHIRDSDDEGDDANSQWRSRLCVWTHLGDWCSEDCYIKHKALFRKAGYDARIESIEQLKTLTGLSLRVDARNRFIERIGRLWVALGDQAGNYLASHDGELDQDTYLRSFEQRVDRDLELVTDPEFLARFINGCEVIDVPRFRMDIVGWRSFVESFASDRKSTRLNSSH